MESANRKRPGLQKAQAASWSLASWSLYEILRNPSCGERIGGADLDKNKPSELLRGLKGEKKKGKLT